MHKCAKKSLFLAYFFYLSNFMKMKRLLAQAKNAYNIIIILYNML